MTALPAPHTLLTADQERALAAAIRAGRRARLLAQRHLAARLRRELPPAISARTAAAAVLAALVPLLPLDPDALVAALVPLLPPLDPDARQRVLAALVAWPLDQHALTAGAAARAAFAAANHRLVVAFARRYDHRGLPLDDLVQEGTLGLLRAIDLFDPDRGARFSTYAAWWSPRPSAAPWPSRSPSPTSPSTSRRTAPASPARPTPSTPPSAIPPPPTSSPPVNAPSSSPATASTGSPRAPCRREARALARLRTAALRRWLAADPAS